MTPAASATTTWELEGGAPLRGSVRAQGAKNAASKELVATLLTDEPCILHDVPAITEIDATLAILHELGAESSRSGTAVEIATAGITGSVSERYSGLNRIPILLVGPLLNRVGEAVVPMVGGCRIGQRPVDFHVEGLAAMGAEIAVRDRRWSRGPGASWAAGTGCRTRRWAPPRT